MDLESLDTARGCVLVWPSADESVDEMDADGGEASKVWACLGAAYYRLGQRVVVVLCDESVGGPQSALAASGLATVSENVEGPGLSHMLMAALVQSRSSGCRPGDRGSQGPEGHLKRCLEGRKNYSYVM